MCTSHRYASNDLCKAITAVTRRLCSEFVDPEGLSALVGSFIGIGETLRRIIARAVLSTFKDDILMAAGLMQLCAGQESGCEAAVHVMQKLFSSPEVEAVPLLVDAFLYIDKRHSTTITYSTFVLWSIAMMSTWRKAQGAVMPRPAFNNPVTFTAGRLDIDGHVHGQRWTV